jgi:hypothetical protein
MGQQFLFWRSYSCACHSASSGAPDARCKICSGKGHYWLEPVEAGAAAASQRTQMEWAKSGLYESGDLVLSVPQNSVIWDAGQFDRVTARNATDRFSAPLIRAAPNERLSFRVESIERVFWKDSTGTALIEGGIPTVDVSGSLSWSDGAPPDGTTYSITGTKLIDYFIYQELPRNRNLHNGVRLPKAVVLRKFDLLGR